MTTFFLRRIRILTSAAALIGAVSLLGSACSKAPGANPGSSSGGRDASGPAVTADGLYLQPDQFPEPAENAYPGEGERGPIRLIETRYPTEDAVIADVVATDGAYGADNTGSKDSTAAIQLALYDCKSMGGGTVYLPAGRYLVTSGLVIPAFVTLRGDWQDPDEGTGYGTVILADVESSDTSLPALFSLGGSAGVNGLTVYYPRQSIDHVQPYPFTFYVNGTGDGYMLQTIANCTVINGYRGIGACVEETNAHEMMTIDNVKGTFLSVGVEAYNQADVGTWKNLTISNQYWAEASSGLVAADREKLDAYTLENTTGLRLGDLEWTEFANIQVSGCKTGVDVVKGKRIEFAGSFLDVTVTGCETAMRIQSMDERWGMTMARCRLEGSENALLNNSGGVVKAVGLVTTGRTSGGIVTDAAELDACELDYSRTPAKPPERLFLVSADMSGQEDASGVLQEQLDAAGKAGGGVVYLPAGQYRLDNPVAVPAGVELRGSSSVPTREQNGNSSGTLLLVYYGRDAANPDTDTAAVTLAGENAGIRGVRFLYPENGAAAGVRPYAYTVRGAAAGVYAVNTAISGGYNGVDFRGCDGHFIKKFVCCCYSNAMAAGGKNGQIEGCLQNGNMLYRDGVSFSGWPQNEADIQEEVMNAITRPNTTFIRLENAENQKVYNSFAYGVKTLADVSGSTGVLIANVGADNLGEGSPLLKTTGGSVTAVNVMRYNGISYENDGAALQIYNRLTINDKEEPSVSE